MSIKLMSCIWEKDLGHSEQSVLLAMADYADDEGRNCYPSYDRLAWKTGYSKRQVNRIIADLCARGIIAIIKQSSQHQATHYWIRLDKAPDKTPFRVDISDSDSSVDNLSTLHNIRVDTVSTLNDSNISSVDISDIPENQGRQMEHPGWTNETSSVDTMSTDPSLEPPIETTDEDELPVRDANHQAWFDTYQAEMPEGIESLIAKHLSRCPKEAVIYAIRSSVNAKERTFGYLKSCALNYIPPAPATNGYHVDIPGVHVLPPAQQPAPVAAAPPLDAGDPWAIVLAEILPVLTHHAAEWLRGSTLRESGQLAGVPLYRVIANTEPANIGWLSERAEPLIRKKLSSIFRKRILVEIIAAEREPMP